MSNNEIGALKAEIERLTEELEAKKKECREIADDYQEMGTFYYNETVKTAELKKQVDELEAENEELAEANFKLKTLYDYSKGYKAGRRDGRHDTAKEILQELWDETEPLNESHKWVRLRIKNIASRKGVEVE